MRQYLHCEPDDDPDAFADQAGLALALEERFIKQLGAAVGNRVAEVMKRALGGR